MNLQIKILNCNNLKELPTIEDIKAIPRGLKVKVKFGEKIAFKRAKFSLKHLLQQITSFLKAFFCKNLTSEAIEL